MLDVTPYRQNGLAQVLASLGMALQGGGSLIQGMRQHQMNRRTLGDVLGYPQQAGLAKPNMMLTPADTRPAYAKDVFGPQVPMGAPGRPTFVGAPTALQPILGSTVRDFSRLSNSIGDTNLRALIGGINPKSAFDENSLFFNPADNTFGLSPQPGAIPTSPRKAGVIQRQTSLNADIKNKERLMAWRNAAEARMRRGGVSKEMMSGLKNDLDLLDLRLNEGFEDMDQTSQDFVNSNIAAALSRLQRFGVNPTKEVTRKTQDVYGKKSAAPIDPRQQRFNALKAEYPTMSDDELMALMAMEEAGK